jgi:hypothetical protein
MVVVPAAEAEDIMVRLRYQHYFSVPGEAEAEDRTMGRMGRPVEQEVV